MAARARAVLPAAAGEHMAQHVIGVHVPVCVYLQSWLQGQQGRLKKAIFEYVILAGSSFLPHFCSFV